MKEEKIKCYELDFGDQNLISSNVKDILDWIETGMYDLKEGDELNYTIKIKFLTNKQYAKLPEWGS